MHYTTIALAASSAVGLVAGHSIGAPSSGVVRRDAVRKTPLLLNIPGLPPTPKLPSKKGPVAQVTGLAVNDIQGDILIGMKKPKELFYFSSINDAAAFKAALKSTIIPRVTSTQTLLGDVSAQPAAMLNIAFTNTGLKALGVTDNLQDPQFVAGQFADASLLKDDNPATNWVQGFQGTGIHGVFLLASDQDSSITDLLDTLTSALGTATTEVHRLEGAARPGDQEGHEHFGFLDGIAQPAINGFNTPLPGQSPIDPGVILTGETGDSKLSSRPSWMKDGSFLAFRQLKQLVPEFNNFLAANPVNGSSELTGARMVGRWKSGAPVDLAPFQDDPALGVDPTRNNNFNFSHPEIPGFALASDESRCPFSAHIRKTHPRADLANTANQIIRAGIPYGPEVTDAENTSGQTTVERGLAFVAYQSVIASGFRFQQNAWADSATFVFGKSHNPGLDPIIGQAGNGAARSTAGIDPTNPTASLSIPAFIVSRGGEYFFSPSISALTSKIAA